MSQPRLFYTLNGEPLSVCVGEFTTIGRGADNQVCVPVESVSTHHAIITREGDRYVLTDCGSANGILYEGRQVASLQLHDGTTFTLGEVTFRFARAATAADLRLPATDAAVPAHAPAPAAGVEKLMVLSGQDVGAELVLSGAPVILGSDPACGLRLRGEGVLPRHAQVERRQGAWTLRALDTSRPIESEGRLLAELRLEHGQTFLLGNVQVRFVTPRAVIEVNPLAGAPVVDVSAAVAELHGAYERILAQVGKIIIGQREVVDEVLVALFARGHCLLIGVPGLAKTLMVRALAGTLDLDSKRIQFTPDLMPSDITGTDILEEDPVTRTRRFRFHRGPLFTNMLLADEINRTPPKTQAALLEAMQERRVTASGISYKLAEPFMVLATQNPIEQEGTYPLPEAQLDRFMFCIHMEYPAPADEQKVLLETTRDLNWEVERVLHADAILKFQHLVRQVPISEHLALYATNLIRATRPGDELAPDFISRWVRWGAGTRAGQYLLLAAKAHVLLSGRFSVSCADVRRYALPVLRHRIFTNFAAASEGITPDDIVSRVLETVKEPTY